MEVSIVALNTTVFILFFILGMTVYAEDPILNNIMKVAAEKMNLKVPYLLRAYFVLKRLTIHPGPLRRLERLYKQEVALRANGYRCHPAIFSFTHP